MEFTFPRGFNTLLSSFIGLGLYIFLGLFHIVNASSHPEIFSSHPHPRFSNPFPQIRFMISARQEYRSYEWTKKMVENEDYLMFEPQ
jgi:hypothetical protein